MNNVHVRVSLAIHIKLADFCSTPKLMANIDSSVTKTWSQINQSIYVNLECTLDGVFFVCPRAVHI